MSGVADMCGPKETPVGMWFVTNGMPDRAPAYGPVRAAAARGRLACVDRRRASIRGDRAGPAVDEPPPSARSHLSDRAVVV